ncbi:MAG: hypothetical protein P1P90_00990, partial [Patescibacteria group bacterium]|nr:hypothetical protein [Patescibacteria group bacterium]
MPITSKQKWLYLTSKSLPKSFKPKIPILMNKHMRWRETAKKLKLSKRAHTKLEWIIWYETKGKNDAYKTARYFGITPKTFYKWQNRFDESNLFSLEEQSKCPKNFRKKEYTP